MKKRKGKLKDLLSPICSMFWRILNNTAAQIDIYISIIDLPQFQSLVVFL